MTLLIKQEDIQKVLTMQDTIRVVEDVFRAHGLKKVQQPPKVYLEFGKGDLRTMPAYIHYGGMNIAGIKEVNVHTGNKALGLPTVMATILLVDPETGYNFAIMDGTLITSMRTGAAGAIAAKYLAKMDSRTAAFVGTGIQARTQLEGLMCVRDIKGIRAYSIVKQEAEDFCKWANEKFNISAVVSDSVENAVRNADIIVTTTPSRSPLVKVEWISPGTHINAIGADAPGKQELFSDVVQQNVVVVDEWEQASHSGEINVPVSRGTISRDDIYAELGEIVAGLKKGRTDNNTITIFDSTGLAIQDISTAFFVYNKIKEKSQNIMEIKFF